MASRQDNGVNRMERINIYMFVLSPKIKLRKTFMRSLKTPIASNKHIERWNERKTKNKKSFAFKINANFKCHCCRMPARLIPNGIDYSRCIYSIRIHSTATPSYYDHSSRYSRTWYTLFQSFQLLIESTASDSSRPIMLESDKKTYTHSFNFESRLNFNDNSAAKRFRFVCFFFLLVFQNRWKYCQLN